MRFTGIRIPYLEKNRLMQHLHNQIRSLVIDLREQSKEDRDMDVNTRILAPIFLKFPNLQYLDFAPF